MSERKPARAEYAAIDEPALPELTTDVARKPNCSAAETAVADERSFTVPVGFGPSYLISSRRTPSSAARRGHSSSGVAPSPSDTRCAGSVIGNTGAYRQKPAPSKMPGPAFASRETSYRSS